MSQAMQSNEPRFTTSPVSDVIGAEVVGLDDATGALERVRDERDLVKVVLKVGSGY